MFFTTRLNLSGPRVFMMLVGSSLRKEVLKALPDEGCLKVSVGLVFGQSKVTRGCLC